MLRRITAWVLLAGFLFLILNLIVLRYYWQLSMVIYLIIVFIFILTNRQGGKTGAGRADDARESREDGVNENEDKEGGE